MGRSTKYTTTPRNFISQDQREEGLDLLTRSRRERLEKGINEIPMTVTVDEVGENALEGLGGEYKSECTADLRQILKEAALTNPTDGDDS